MKAENPRRANLTRIIRSFSLIYSPMRAVVKQQNIKTELFGSVQQKENKTLKIECVRICFLDLPLQGTLKAKYSKAKNV